MQLTLVTLMKAPLFQTPTHLGLHRLQIEIVLHFKLLPLLVLNQPQIDQKITTFLIHFRGCPLFFVGNNDTLTPFGPASTKN